MNNKKESTSRLSEQSSYENACRVLIRYCLDIRDKSLNAKTNEDHEKLETMLNTLNAELERINRFYANKVNSDRFQAKVKELNDHEQNGTKILDPNMKRLYYVYEVYNSNLSEFSKAEKIIKIYPTSKDFNQDYYEIAPLFMNQFYCFFESLIEIEYLIKKYETNKEIIKVNDEHRLEKHACYDNYEYAKFIVNEFINSDEINIKAFLSKYGLSAPVMNYCESILKELDVDLYNKYVLVKNQKEIEYNNYLNDELTKIYEGIINGFYLNENGYEKPFDVLTLFSMIPKFETNNFYQGLKTLMKKINFDEFKANTICKYLVANNICQISLTENYNAINEIVSAADIPVSKQEKDLIVAYMRSNNLPINSSIFMLCINKFRNYELNLINIEEKDFYPEEKYTIIQSTKKRSN